VIIGKLIPAATGLKRYRRIEIEPSEPLPRAIDEVGMLEDGAFAAELGLNDGEDAPAFGASFESDLSDLEAMGTGDGEGFAEELASLDVPPSDDKEKKE
jgi:DNA-directed RNA polymerase subunit beta'